MASVYKDFIINAAFQDFDLFAEQARAWELDFVQLDRGRPEYKLLMASCGRVEIARSQFSRKIYQHGATPRGGRTFAIPVNPNLELDWFGYQVTGHDLLVFPNHGELESLSFPQFDVVTLTVDSKHLEEMAERHAFMNLEKQLNVRPVIRLESHVMKALRAKALRLTEALSNLGHAVLRQNTFRHELEYELVQQVLQLVVGESHAESITKPKLQMRKACVQSAIEILKSGESSLTVQELCVQTHVSERTLQYAFKERFGVTPKGVIRAWNLHQVRRSIQSQGARIKIGQIAGEFGFWHMGQFAADYRKMFGELPSETQMRLYA